MAHESIWPTRPLKDCAVWYSGGTPNKGTARYWGGSIPWISAKSLNGFFVSDSEDRVTEEGANNGTRLVPKDSILFIVRGMSLKSEFRMGIATRPVTFNQDLKALVAVTDVVPAYLAYAIRSKTTEILQMVGEAGHGTGVLPTDLIQALEIPVPSFEEQHAVSAVLAALDDKIELNRQMNETLEAMARALFRSWFVDFDPVRAKQEGRAPYGMDAETAALFPDAFEDSELGPIPKGWRPARLAELTTKIGSGATPRGGDKAYVEHGVAFIRSQNVYDSFFTWDGLVRINDDDAARLRGVTVQRGDVLLNITGASILRTCVVEPAALPARVNQHVAIVRAKDGVPSRYIHNHLLRPATKHHLMGMDAGASRQAVTKGHIEAVPILAPSPAVLAAWAKITDPLYSQIECLTIQSRTLAELRDTVLPKLISGELRLPEARDLTESALAEAAQ